MTLHSLFRIVFFIFLTLSHTIYSHGEDNFTNFKIISGSVTGVYYPTAGAFCRIINKNSNNKYCSVIISEGSLSTSKILQSNPLNYALIQSDIAENKYLHNDFRNLRQVFSATDELFTILVRKNSRINSFNDLETKAISFGNKGNGAATIFEQIIQVKNMDVNNFHFVESNPSDLPENLCEGKIDAAVLAVSEPNGLVQEILQKCETEILALNKNEIDSLLKNNKTYKLASFTDKYYKIPRNVKTIAIKSCLYTTSEMDTDQVYDFTKTIFENIDSIQSFHPAFQSFHPGEMANQITDVPLHPGARKYFLEQKLMK